MSRWLVLSDLQIPFEAPGALKLAKQVQKDLKIPRENVFCVGDEVDNYWGSAYDHDPDALHTPNQELSETREKIRMWADAFPLMRVARSNHGERWDKKQAMAGIPREFRVPYQRVLRIPRGWRFANRWVVKCRYPWQVLHGLGYSSMYAYRHIPLDQGISTAFGHLHSSAGIAYIVTQNGEPGRWGMNTGCMINPSAYAFKYGSDSKFKPVLSLGAVVDNGLTPLIFRLGA